MLFGALKLNPYAILWSIWKERIDRIFRNEVVVLHDILKLEKARTGKKKRAFLRKEIKKIDLDDILHNREVWFAVLPKERKNQR